ncbi:hypothetical protein Tco_0920488 [Tanacetum coccineum]
MGVLSILEEKVLNKLSRNSLEDIKTSFLKALTKMLWGDLMIMSIQGDMQNFGITANLEIIKNRYPSGQGECFQQMLELRSHLIHERQKGFECWLTTTQQMVFGSPCLTDLRITCPEQQLLVGCPQVYADVNVVEKP